MKMLDPVRIHTEVYDLLMQYHSRIPSFYFSFRVSNRGGMLEKGYLFNGDEWHLAVSFWTGMDWRSQIPNISFIILFKTGETYLEVNVSDSDRKREFVNQYLVKKLRLEITGTQYRKTYQGDYKKTLQQFLKNDKVLIDKVISQYSDSFFKNKEQGIFLIDSIDFIEQKSKIERYKKNEFLIKENQINVKPIKLNAVRIENFGPIKEVDIAEIPFSSQWIFFTGENGTGKTSILRAITTCICNKEIKSEPEYPSAEVVLGLYISSNITEKHIYSSPDNSAATINEPFVNGFAAYGQSRLRTNRWQKEQNKNEVDVNNLTSSIFDENACLIDLQYQFNEWALKNDSKYKQRQRYVTEILTDILPNLYNINFNDEVGEGQVTTYIEKDIDGETYRKVTFDKLASGLKSLVAMIGDILIRLYNQQPYIDDPSEFTGIVLIDEIDIHLHPKLQRQLVIQLSKTFPQIQFIATTHSPIPFLGAPKNSQIFKVERTRKDGVKTRRLDEKIEISDLLPNTILTSPIFGLDEIIPESHESNRFVRTETTYEEMGFNDKLKKVINEFITDAKEQELINLFKERRK